MNDKVYIGAKPIGSPTGATVLGVQANGAVRRFDLAALISLATEGATADVVAAVASIAAAVDADKDATELARSIAMAAGRIYPTTSAGLAAWPTNGDLFFVYQPGGESAQLYKNVSGAAVSQNFPLPSTNLIDQFTARIGPNGRFTFSIEDAKGNSIAYALPGETDLKTSEGERLSQQVAALPMQPTENGRFPFSIEDSKGNSAVALTTDLQLLNPSIGGDPGGGGETPVSELVHLEPGDTYWRQWSSGNWRPARIYASGITREDVDFAWDISRADKKLAVVYPPDADRTPVIASYYLDGKTDPDGTFPIRWTSNPLVDPLVDQLVLPVGDSTWKNQPWINPGDPANSNSDPSKKLIEGAIFNEVSRQLTGIGTRLTFYVQDPISKEWVSAARPPSGSLSKIKFIGTLGPGPIKHEARSGWREMEYISRATSGGKTNAFWNPASSASSKFDLAYYLQQNGFMHDQMAGGALADFSNVNVAIKLGWNNVYNGYTDNEIRVNAATLLDRIHETAPGAKVTWFGLPAPPDTLFKIQSLGDDFEEGVGGGRRISAPIIFESAIKRTADLYREVIETRPWAEFYQTSHLINSDTAFPKQRYLIDPSGVAEIEGSYDYVHMQAHGCASEADVITNYYAYKLCSGD